MVGAEYEDVVVGLCMNALVRVVVDEGTPSLVMDMVQCWVEDSTDNDAPLIGVEHKRKAQVQDLVYRSWVKRGRYVVKGVVRGFLFSAAVGE